MYAKGGINGDIRYLLWPMQVEYMNIWLLLVCINFYYLIYFSNCIDVYLI